jgi:hypothetical protein
MYTSIIVRIFMVARGFRDCMDNNKYILGFPPSQLFTNSLFLSGDSLHVMLHPGMLPSK